MRTRVWLVLVLPLLELSYSLSQGVEVEQVCPMNNEPICLGVQLEYRCTVQDSSLRWSYSGQSANGPPIFFTSDFGLIGSVFPVGPFDIVLLSISNDGSTVVLSSSATLRAGLTVNDNGSSITCFDADQQSDGFTIEIAELKIDMAFYFNDTICWNPPPCDANCTISVDEEDIATVPCSNGSLSAMSDLSSKTVNIAAADQLGQSKAVQALPTMVPCGGGTSTAAKSGTTIAVTTGTSPPAGDDNTTVILDETELVIAVCAVSVSVTALLFLVMSGLMGMLVVYYMWKKERKGRKSQEQAVTVPDYDIPEPLQGSNPNIELEENICYSNKYIS